jgi:hypothetical protein
MLLAVDRADDLEEVDFLREVLEHDGNGPVFSVKAKLRDADGASETHLQRRGARQLMAKPYRTTTSPVIGAEFLVD